MIVFKNKQNQLEIDLLGLEEDKSIPSNGDARIMISVSSNGYSGNNDVWVSSQALKDFCTSLKELEENRQGEATLKSISPNELELIIFAVDSLGHLGIKGLIGCDFFSENTTFNHSVQFGFEFDPSQLLTAVKESWVEMNK